MRRQHSSLRFGAALLTSLALVAALTPHAGADGGGFDLSQGLAPPALPVQGGLTYPNLGSGLSGLADDPFGAQYGADFLWGGDSGGGGSDNGVAASPLQPGDSGNHTASMLALSIIVDGDVGRVVDVINASGGDVRNVLGDYIEAYVPPTALARLARTPGVSWARELARPLQARGTVTSGGVAWHLASAWHDAGIKGQGVKIGVIDLPSGSTTRDGFTGAPALLGTDLPSAVSARCYTDLGKHTSDIADCSAAGGSTHGTIVAETVMDVAPEASLYIANPSSRGDLRSTAEWMHREGVGVIVYSVIWQFHGPPDGTSPYAYGPLNTVKWAADNGIVWVNAAGNWHRDTWYGPFADADKDNIHEWRTGVEDQYLTLKPFERARVFMRWDDTWGGADDDLALMVVSKPGSPDESVFATANDSQTGGAHHDPFEWVTVINRGWQSRTVALRVKSMDGSKPSWIQLVTWGGVLGTQSDGYSVQSPADSPHPGMLAVGAGSPVGVYSYSSRGPTPDGRIKPDIVGAAGMGTVTRGRFQGTSAAAPHVGGLAALVVQQNPGFAPADVTGYLKTHAKPNGDVVPNNTWGHGFAQLPSPSCAQDLNGSGTTPGSWTNDCVAAVDSAKSGRYYNIRVLQESAVTIDLSSSVDSYLRLRNGYNAQQGAALHSDDNGGTGSNARISATLAAGTYTIEATTATDSQTGAFSLSVSGLAAVPEVSLSGGAEVTEGSNVTFTVTASPIPSSPLPVKVQVTTTGDYGVTPSTRTINIPTSTGSTDLVLSTANDNVPEVNGGITATLVKGTDYDVSSSASAATVGVNDNDNFSCHDIVAADGSVDGTLVTNCKQSFYSEDSKRYARFYSFEIAQQSGVVIEMESTELNPYLMLRLGKDARSGTPLHFNDNAGESQNPPGAAVYLNARIAEGLSAGWYTIEATSLDHEKTGAFKMQIRGLSPQTSVPVISIAGDDDITEGEDASFTLTASPAPASDLDVTVAVTQDGDFATTGSQTVTIPATGSATLTVPTDNDSVREPAGSITAAIADGNGYAVSSTISVSERTGAGIATVNVANDDGGICTEALTADGTVSGAWGTDCESFTFQRTYEYLTRWARYYIFELEQSSKITIDLTSGHDTYLFLRSGKDTQSGQPLHENDDIGGGNPNSRISETLAAGWYTIEATTLFRSKTGDFSLTISGLATRPTEPEVSIAAGSGVSEGSAASFTVTATPKPAADLDVTINVSQSGDFGATTGSRTVTIPASGSKTFTIATTNDSADEADGSVTSAVSAGTGYTVSSGSGSATVAVADDDVPEVSIAAGGGVTEGGDAEFTLTASPVPAAGLDVTVAVAQDGDFGVATGSRTVTIPASGSFALAVATSDDSVDEADGSVTATVGSGTGYTVSATKSAATVAVSDDDDPLPVISIVGGSAVTEGGNATYTLTASPSPATPLTVNLTVSQSGDFYVGTGPTTVQIATSGTHTLSLGTTNDSTDEPDGSLTVTLSTGTGYTVSTTQSAATVAVSDDDDPPPPPPVPAGCVSDEVLGLARDYFDLNRDRAPSYGRNWRRVLVAFGDVVDDQLTAFTAAEALEGEQIWFGWKPFREALECIEAAQQPDDPEISITAGSAVTEGTAASFTLTASPAPTAVLTVDVTVAQTGDFGVTTGTRKVTIPTTGSYTLTVTTTGDGIDEADGSVTVTVDTGTGYTVSSSAGSASVAVADNDVPEVSVAAGSGITEGGDATFTVTAAPTPYAALSVEVTVAQSGDFGATTGSRTVTIPTNGSYTLTVSTVGDNVDEPDGSVTMSVSSGTGYTVSSSAGSATVAVSDDDDDSPPPVPEISIAAGSAVTEGTAASFTLTANPTPASALTVSVTVAQSGDYGADTGVRTVTIPTGGSYTLTVATTNDNTDEADGSVTATISTGTGYIVSSTQSAATVAVSDDDDPPPPPPPVPADCVSDETLESARDYYDLNRDRAPGNGRNWRRVLIAFGDVTDDQLTAMTAAEALEREQLWFGWRPFREALECIEAAQQPANPEISIAAGSGVTEGSSASFTLTASPAPAAALSVDVSVSQSGDFGVTTGSRTVTIPTAGAFTLTVDTTGDSTDEADGSVTVTIDTGTGYTVSSSAGSATVAVADDDDPPPPPPPPPPADPEISITAGSDVAEGTAATFTLTASPAPASALRVTVTVAQSGSFGVSTGARTVTIPTGGSYTLTVATTNDSTDEADGSVTVTIGTGTGYIVSSTQSAATVAVSDDDDPPPPPPPPVPAGCVSDEVLELARDYFDLNRDRAPSFGRNWRRVLVAFGDVVDDELTAFTAAEALEGEQIWFGWRPFREALECIEAAQQSEDPEISIAAGSAVTEGTAASFIITASPKPAASLDVTVTVSQSGDYGATTGARAVTIPTTGSYTLTVATADDTADEADGSVTATVDSGTGYTVSSSDSSASVAVADDDVPEVSIAAGSDVAEGTAAAFTLTASPVPAASLVVSVTVSQSGDFAVTGERTVTIPTTGSATFTVATADDATDEADGSVTATISDGTGYTVSSSAGAATVAVSDDDDPPPPPDTPVISIVGGTAVTEGGNATYTITASPAPTAPLTISLTISQNGSFHLSPGPTTIQMATSGTHTLSLGTHDDSTDEADGSLTVTVDSGTGYTVSSTQNAATVAVSDNDLAPAGPPTVTVSDATAAEDAQHLAFVVTLSKPNPVPITFRYGGYARTATLWQDWSIEYKAFTLDTGDTTIDVTVPIIDDDTQENDETLRIYVYAISGIVIRDGFLYATGTITDND